MFDKIICQVGKNATRKRILPRFMVSSLLPSQLRIKRKTQMSQSVLMGVGRSNPFNVGGRLDDSTVVDGRWMLGGKRKRPSWHA